jgi:hypothetical protein
MISLRVAADQAINTPVINDIVDVLNSPFGFGIATLIINPKIMAESDIGDCVH